MLQIMSSQQVGTIRSRMAGYPTIRTSDHSDTPPLLKKVRINKKVRIYNNVSKHLKKQEDGERVEYYAQLIAETLNDPNSLSFYRVTCMKFDPSRLLEKATAIVKDGGARNPAAVFVSWTKSLLEEKALVQKTS